MRRGSVYRIPVPPNIMGDFASHQQDMKAISDYFLQLHVILNPALQSMQNRLNTIQQTGATAPPAVQGLTVTGRQGAFYLTWKRIVNVDGYEIEQASDAAMTQFIGRFNVPGADTCTWSLAVGNAATTAYFRVYAYQGTQYGPPSPAVSGVTVAFGGGEAALPTPAIAPRPVLVAPLRSGLTLP